jgi:hypothetical protein
MKEHEIYAGATYRMNRGLSGPETVEVTAVDASGVSYKGVKGFMIGSCPIDLFAKDAVRVFLHRPTVDDVCEMVKRMDPAQHTELMRRLASQIPL